MRSQVILCVLFSYASLCTAQDGGFKCNWSGKQQEMNACAIRDFKLADAELNKQYKLVMAGLSGTEQSRLRGEQRVWLERRDPGCKEKVKGSEGGSIWPQEYFSCLASVSQKRAEELEVLHGDK